MRRKHLIAGAATVAALAGGAAGAVAATSDHKAAEQAVLSDAAKRLGVSAAELRSALASAEDAKLDAAVKAGELTQAQADEIKRHRRQEGTVLGLGGPGHRGFDGPRGRHGGPPLLADAAQAIGIDERSLMNQLRDGTSLAAIAKAHGKTLADVKAAVKRAATSRVDADLDAGRITQAQHDEAISRLDDAIAHLGEFPGPGSGRPGPGPGRPGPPPWHRDHDAPPKAS